MQKTLNIQSFIKYGCGCLEHYCVVGLLPKQVIIWRGRVLGTLSVISRFIVWVVCHQIPTMKVRG